jgi:hypothetical protein
VISEGRKHDIGIALTHLDEANWSLDLLSSLEETDTTGVTSLLTTLLLLLTGLLGGFGGSSGWLRSGGGSLSRSGSWCSRGGSGLL